MKEAQIEVQFEHPLWDCARAGARNARAIKLQEKLRLEKENKRLQRQANAAVAEAQRYKALLASNGIAVPEAEEEEVEGEEAEVSEAEEQSWLRLARCPFFPSVTHSS